ncbi:thiamine phosphate synthase [uncultured Sphingomonas sp.]|uniref:thiamine phosphate synthase n=1 Tax=uncultured Sphingomonas sp. TaxID=158754 RepID=UPI0025E60675|nr:thiamine phosphate synthase [uncultured Sphingomonas sp.]
MTDSRLGSDLPGIVRRLPRGSGVVVRHHHLPPAERRALLRRLRRLATGHGVKIVDDQGGCVARVHSARELCRALLRKPELLFLSPLFATRSHPDWQPLGHMRAAALVRMAKRPAMALGGMSARRYRQVRSLGFAGWGGIDAWTGRGWKKPSRE